MDLGLQGIVETLIIGGCFLLGIELLLVKMFGSGYLRGLKSIQPQSALLSNALMVAVSFAAGILLEDVSNRIIDGSQDLEKLVFFWRDEANWEELYVIPSEERIRANVLFEDREITIRPADGGKEQAIVKASLREGLGSELQDRRVFSRYFPDLGVAAERDGWLDWESALVLSSRLYYLAKCKVYYAETYFDEMQTIQSRIDFTRALLAMVFILMLFALLLGLIKLIKPSAGGSPTRMVPQSTGTTMVREEITERRILLRRSSLYLAFLLVCALLARIAFVAEEEEFDRRAYGYFSAMHVATPGLKNVEEPNGQSSPGQVASQPTCPALDCADGYSGFARLDGNRVVVVHDKKYPLDLGHRLGVLSIADKTKSGSPRKLVCHAVIVEWNVWRPDPRPASDLEAICVIPGRANEYLLVESGHYKNPLGGEFKGRIFHIRITGDGNGWQGQLMSAGFLPEGVFQFELEGIACVAARGSSLTVLLGERGGGGNKADSTVSPAVIHEAKIELQPTLTQAMTIRLTGRRATFGAGQYFGGGADVRSCSDLYWDAGAKKLWVAAAVDGGNRGPFRSAIFEIGSLGSGGGRMQTGFDSVERPTWVIEGLKVEGIGPAVVTNGLGIASDDEDYGGIWWPLESSYYEFIGAPVKMAGNP